jgi:hypothetical protein
LLFVTSQAHKAQSLLLREWRSRPFFLALNATCYWLGVACLRGQAKRHNMPQKRLFHKKDRFSLRFQESLSVSWRNQLSFLDAQKHSSSFSETKDALSILCGKRILEFLAPHGTDGLLIVLDEGLTLECLCGVMEEFSIIQVLERI